MSDKLKVLFADNPYIPEKIAVFCDDLPEYREAERTYREMGDKLCQQLGYEAFNTFDEVQSNYMAKQAYAYYLFGLGLRQELIQELL